MQSGFFGTTGHARRLPVPLVLVALATLVAAPVADGATNTIATIAGGGSPGFSGDGGAATAALLNGPSAAAIDPAGNLYVADTYNQRIRKVTPNGAITTIAGNGTEGDTGDGGPATSATLAIPLGVSVDASGSILIADAFNNRIRKVDPNGTITTIAGNGTAGFSGDNGPATGARLNGPASVTTDTVGNLFVADTENHRIRKVAPNGTITTIAGNGTAGFSGDNGPATAAQLNNPSDVALDANGNLIIADNQNHRIRKVAPNGTITTIAGNGTAGFSGDNGPATAAQLNNPSDVAPGPSGSLYIADTANNRVRRLSADGTISTIAGNGTSGFSGDNSWATSAGLANPTGLAVDGTGNIYIVDSDNHRVRRMGPPTLVVPKPAPAPTVPRKGGLTATRVATHAKLTVPKGARVTLKVASTSRRVCTVRSNKLVSLKKGTCRVTVTVTPKRGKTQRATVSLRSL